MSKKIDPARVEALERQNADLRAQLDLMDERVKRMERQLAGSEPLSLAGLTILDQGGRPRIELNGGGPEGPELRMSDAKGAIRLRLRVVTDMPIFELQDSRENPKTWLGVGADGNPVIQLRDGTGRDRLAIRVSRRKGAKLSIISSSGQATTVAAEGVLLTQEGIVRKLYLKAEAEEERARRPHLTLIDGGLTTSEIDEED